MAGQLSSIGMADTYSGKPDENLDNWLDCFQAATAQNTSEARPVNFLKARLRGAARDALDAYSVLEVTVEALVDHLRKFFVREDPYVYQNELMNGKRREDEDFRRCYLRVMKLVSKGFPEVNQKSQEGMSIHYFCSWIGAIGEKVRRRKPKTSEQAINQAEIMEMEEAPNKKTRRENLTMMKPSGTAYNSMVIEEDSYAKLVSDVDSIKQTVSNLARSSSRTTPNSGSSIPSSVTSSRACFQCRQKRTNGGEHKEVKSRRHEREHDRREFARDRSQYYQRKQQIWTQEQHRIIFVETWSINWRNIRPLYKRL